MEPGPLDRYRIALRVVQREFFKLGRRSIDGKEPHDIAMQSLFSPAWSRYRVRLDVIDAYRRERGRSGPKRKHLERKFHQLPSHLSTLDDPPREDDWLDGWEMTPAETRIAILIAGGFTKTEAAKWLQITQTAVWDALRRIGKRNPCHGTTNPRKSSSETSSSTSSTGTSDGPSSPSPSPDAHGSGPS